MKHHTSTFRQHNIRTFLASLLTYLLLTSQLAPLAFAANAANGSAPRNAAAKNAEVVSEQSAVTGERFAPVPVPLAAPAAVAPIITATKVDSFADSDGDGKAEPGEIITYSVTLTNTGPDPALNLTLNDTVDANTTLIGGSATSTPIGVGDAFSVIGNVRIQVPDGVNDLLANDNDPETGTNAGLTITTLAGDNSAPFAGTSVNNGQVTATTGDGSFQYNPPPGFTGADTFTYIVSDSNGASQPVTVTLTVSGMIWFVNSAASCPCDGRITNPFAALTGAGSYDAVAVDEAGDNIFLYSGAYTGGLTFLANERLIGQGATATLATIAGVTVPTFSDPLPGTAGASPTITTVAAATNALNVSAGGITLRGFTIGNTTGAKIFGNAFGTLTVGNNASPDVILGGTGQAINLTNGTFAATSGFASVATTSSTGAGVSLIQVAGTVAFGSTTVSGSSAQGIFVNQSTADINFGNTSVSGGTDGVALQSNTAGTRTFGTLSVSNNSGIGFLSSAGGNATITGATLIPAAAQTAPVGTGIDIQSLAAGTAVTFAGTTVNKGNAGTGVNLGTIATPNLGNVTFNSLAITTANGSGLVSAANTGTTGQINVTTNAGSISSTNGPAINITKTVAPATPITLNFTSVSSTNSSTTGLTLDRVSGNATIGTTTTTNPTGVGISVTNTSAGGTMNFGNTTSNTSAGTGVSLGTNAGAVTFADLDIAPDATAAAFILANSTATTTSTSGTIATIDALAVSVTNSPLNMTLTSVTADNTGDPDSCVSLTTASGTLNIQGGTLTGGTGAVFLVSGGNPTVTFSGTIIQNSAGRVIDIQGTTGNTITFNTGTITGGSSSLGVHIADTTAVAGNVTFSNGLTLGTAGARMTNQALTIGTSTGTFNLGTVSIFTNNVQGLVATNADGTLNITTGTVNSTNATAINIDGPVGLTTLGITLTRVDSTGGASNGINLVDTNGTFTIAGTGTAGSGGTIATKTGVDANFATQGTGVFLSNAAGVSLTRMQMNDFSNFAIRGNNVSGFSFTNSVINGTNGSAAGASDEAAIRFDGLTGSATISNNSITHGFEYIVKVLNASGTLNRLTMDANSFGNTDATLGGDAVQIVASNTATLNATVTSSTFINAREDLFNAVVTQSASMDLVFRLNTLSNSHTPVLSTRTNVLLFSTSIGTVTYDISCNKTTGGNDGPAIAAAKGVPDSGSGGTMTGSIINNKIGTTAVANSGSISASGIFISSLRSGTHTTNIANNVIKHYDEAGIFLRANDGASTLNANITGNTANEPDGFGFAGLHADNGALATDTNVTNIRVGDFANAALKNEFSTGDPANFTDVDLQVGRGTMNLSRAGSVAATAVLVIKDDNLNPATTTVSATAAAGAVLNLVNTTPTLPPAVTACVPPAGPQPIDNNSPAPSEVPGEINTPGAPSDAGSSSSAPAPASITDRPFVSSPRQDSAKVAEIQKLVVTSGAGARTVDIATSKSETKPATKPSSDLINPTPPVIVGNNLTWNVGTLPAGQSVTITFQVQVENPYSGPAQVSNQGTVTADGGISVLTDDPAVAGTNNPTVTPIDVPPDIAIKDATVAEPASGTTSMLFTVTLSTPATGPVSVNYATANGGATPATGGTCGGGGVDYATSNGTVNFIAGQQVQTVAVQVCSDATVEPDETFLVNLSTPVNGIIVDGQATGTITANTPGVTLISELRTSGPGGTNDDFVEIYNNTNSPLVVAASDASAGYGLYKSGATSGDTPVLLGTIPNGTVIPARGHYLLVGSAYSLANYGGVGAAAGNLTMSSDIESDRNVALFNTANVVNISSVTRLDAVGFGTNTGGNFDLLREGTNLATATGSTSEYSFVRKLATGTPQDTNDNLADFQVVTTTPATPIGTATIGLGAPGPENQASPIQRNAQIKASLIDTGVASTAPPNRVRDTTPDIPNNSTFGTLDFRRKFTNNTGGSVTRLRFRIVDVTTTPQPAGTADLRARSSGNLVVTITGGSMISVIGTTLEAPPTQPNGGGQNATMSAGTVTLGTPLANGASINLHFLTGIQQNGGFRFFINVEALP